MRARQGVDAFLADWLKQGYGREVAYRAYVRNTAASLTRLLDAPPQPTTLRELLAATLDADGAFHQHVIAEFELSTEDAATWKQVVVTCAGTMLTMFEADPR